LATGCEVKYKWREVGITKDVIHNNGMADVYASAMQKFGVEFPPKVLQEIAAGGSTDFGNVSYEMPCIHPMFGIHTNAANHTVEFTAAAKTVDAHNDTIMASKALALTGVEVLINQKFYDSIQLEFKNFVSHL
jgi:metal-dependent amidase/aminoacylase/carboxypeptidase family protein